MNGNASRGRTPLEYMAMRSMDREPECFAEFWPHYVGEHRQPLCRAIHYAAGILSLGLLIWGVIALEPVWLLLSPIVGYGLAWSAHLLVEHNHPATWGYVWWSLRAEFKMLVLGMTGRMSREVTRLYGCSDPAPDVPRVKK